MAILADNGADHLGNRLSDRDTERILICTPFGKDAEHLSRLLSAQNLKCQICKDIDELVKQIDFGVGVILTTEEVLIKPNVQGLTEALKVQPEWSALPLLVFYSPTSADEVKRTKLAQPINAFADVTFLQRPVSIVSLLSSVNGALRDRRRQYLMRNALESLQDEAKKLKQQEEELRTLANSIPQLTWMAQSDGSVFWYNERWYEYTGQTSAEMSTWGAQNLLDSTYLPLVTKRWQESIESGTPFEMAFPIRGADQNFRLFLTRMIPIRDELGKIKRWFGTNTDIEDATRAQSETLEILETMSDAFFSVDKNWRVTRLNSNHEKLTKIKREDQLGRNLLELFFSDPAFKDSIYVKSYLKAMQERVQVVFEDYYKPLNIWTEVRVFPQRDGGLAAFFSDISERKSNEIKLALEKQKLNSLVSESASAIALMRGPDLVFEIANKKWAELVSTRDYLGRKYADIYPELVGSLAHKSLLEIYETGVPFEARGMPLVVKSAAGILEEQYFDFKNIRISDALGQVDGVYCNAMNVTERVLSRKRLEESSQLIQIAQLAAEASAENLRGFFMQAPSPMVIIEGADLRFSLVNPPYEKLVGRKVLGKTVYEAFGTEELANFVPLIEKVFKTGEPFVGKELALEIKDENGTLEKKWIDVAYHPFRTSEARVKGVLAVVHDVTAGVLARQALEKSAGAVQNERHNIRNLFKQTPEMVAFLKGPNHIFEFVNEAHVRALGFDATGKSVLDAQPESTEIHGILDRVFESGETAELKEIPVTVGKKLRYFNLTYAARRDQSANIDGVMILGTEITEQVEARNALKESQLRYQLLFDHSPLPKWMIDIQSLKFVDVNLAAQRHYGYSKEEFLNLSPAEIHSEQSLHEFFESLNQDFTDEKQIRLRRRTHRKKDGSLIQVEVSALDINLDGRKMRIGAMIDITDRMNSEAQQKELLKSLHSAKEEAERANQLKSAFLANMSHEIRTPLGAMLGFADLLKDIGISDAERANYIDILIRNGNQLSFIINDILDLSKVEAGHMTLEYSEVQPAMICAEVISLLNVKAKEKNLTLDYVADFTTPWNIVTDEVRLRQILLNIIGNAIKFTHVGSIRLRSYSEKSAKGRDAVVFEIIDTGIGIPSDQQSQLFEMFVQGDDSMTRRFGGTGLGLALSRRLARVLGGDVTILNSEEGKGTSFKVVIEDQPEKRSSDAKLETQQARESLDLSPNLLEGVRVLIVDDSPDNQYLFGCYLTEYNAVVDSAENGLLGYQKALTGNHDVVLMDIQMPEMDGYTATQKLRSAGYTKPVIALTAHAMSEIRKKCLNVGCTDQLSKPVNAKELVKAVAMYAKDTRH